MKQEPFFARSLTLAPRSLLLNRTEMLATQAKTMSFQSPPWQVQDLSVNRRASSEEKELTYRGLHT